MHNGDADLDDFYIFALRPTHYDDICGAPQISSLSRAFYDGLQYKRDTVKHLLFGSSESNICAVAEAGGFAW